MSEDFRLEKHVFPFKVEKRYRSFVFLIFCHLYKCLWCMIILYLYNTICLFHIFLVVHYWGFMLIKLAVYHDLWFKWPTWTKFNGFLVLTFYYRLLRRNIYSSSFITYIAKRTQIYLILEIQRHIRTYCFIWILIM